MGPYGTLPGLLALVAQECVSTPEDVEPVVRAVLKSFELHVADNGEIFDPTPRPAVVFSGVRPASGVSQTGVHYKGQRRRRGYRR